MAAANKVLKVTVLHAAAADFFWQHRQRLTAVFGCSSLQITLLQVTDCRGQAMDIIWEAPLGPPSTG
jgi:hypothetical protein